MSEYVLLGLLAIGGILLGIGYYSLCSHLAESYKRVRVRVRSRKKSLPKKESWERLNEESRRFDG